MDREQWRPFLKRWSEEWIAGHDPERDAPLDEDAVRDGWLGFAPASAEEVAAAEARLGRPLPPSLRDFLLVTDGWRDAGVFVYRLAGASELNWLRDSDDSGWIDAYSYCEEDEGGEEDEGSEEDEAELDELDELDEEEINEGAVLRRSLRISLEADAAVMLLDPDDVDEQGEWAGYWLSSWSGMGPERHDSFYDLMYRHYASFHSLRKPEGQTRDKWDAKVEQARLAALDGEVEEPLAVLEEAAAFGRGRARLLRFQLQVMLNGCQGCSNVSVSDDEHADLLRNPLFAAELLPLLLAEGTPVHRDGRFTLDRLIRTDPDSARSLIADYEARRSGTGFRLTFGNREFDAAVHRIVDRLATDPAFDDAAVWLQLREAVRLWRPLNEDHIAPVVLFAEPALAKVITPERGREILSMPRG